MRRLSRSRFDWLFNCTLSAVILIIGWIIPSDLLIKIQVEIGLSVLCLMMAFEFQEARHGNFNALQWSSALLIGALIVGVGLRLEPVWVQSAKLLLSGRPAEAAATLDSRPHANLVLFIGLATMFVAVAGLIRRVLLRWFGLINNVDATDRTA